MEGFIRMKVFWRVNISIVIYNYVKKAGDQVYHKEQPLKPYLVWVQEWAIGN